MEEKDNNAKCRRKHTKYKKRREKKKRQKKRTSFKLVAFKRVTEETDKRCRTRATRSLFRFHQKRKGGVVVSDWSRIAWQVADNCPFSSSSMSVPIQYTWSDCTCRCASDFDINSVLGFFGHVYDLTARLIMILSSQSLLLLFEPNLLCHQLLTIFLSISFPCRRSVDLNEPKRFFSPLNLLSIFFLISLHLHEHHSAHHCSSVTFFLFSFLLFFLIYARLLPFSP